MSDHLHDTPGPLVSRTAEEAAEKMISEGGPLGQPHGVVKSSCCGAWDEMIQTMEDQLHETVRKHPLKSLLAALGLGLLVGGMIRRD
jgi:hypothetical protein